jgi:hypothetical protein
MPPRFADTRERSDVTGGLEKLDGQLSKIRDTNSFSNTAKHFGAVAQLVERHG